MAWAALRADGTAVAVAFMQEQLALSNGGSIVEVDDALVIAVMEGQRSMSSFFDPSPKPMIPEQPMPKQNVDDWFREYPAIMGPTCFDTLRQIAAMISPGAIAVEVGSRLGGSAKIIMDHAPSIQRLYCIDPSWPEPITTVIHGLPDDDLKFRKLWQLDRYETFQDFAQKLLSDYSQVRLLPFVSPYQIRWWREPIDFLFEDSSHWNPQLHDTLEFWMPLVKSGGIIAGHDYTSRCPAVIAEVDALAVQLGTELHVQGIIWWMRKP